MKKANEIKIKQHHIKYQARANTHTHTQLDRDTYISSAMLPARLPAVYKLAPKIVAYFYARIVLATSCMPCSRSLTLMLSLSLSLAASCRVTFCRHRYFCRPSTQKANKLSNCLRCEMTHKNR